jgi:hypothetical protein
MADASCVEAVQRDQGEARRSGVISRPPRRRCVFVRWSDINRPRKIYTPVTFIRFFLIGLSEKL